MSHSAAILQIIKSKTSKIRVFDSDRNLVGEINKFIVKCIFDNVIIRKNKIKLSIGNVDSKLIIRFVNEYILQQKIIDAPILDLIRLIISLNKLGCNKQIILQYIISHMLYEYVDYYSEFISNITDITLNPVPYSLFSKRAIDNYFNPKTIYEIHQNKYLCIAVSCKRLATDPIITDVNKNILLNYFIDKIPDALIDQDLINVINTEICNYMPKIVVKKSLPKSSNKYLLSVDTFDKFIVEDMSNGFFAIRTKGDTICVKYINGLHSNVKITLLTDPSQKIILHRNRFLSDYDCGFNERFHIELI